MMVLVEARDSTVERPRLAADLERRLKEVLGVRVAVAVHDKGAMHSAALLAEETGDTVFIVVRSSFDSICIATPAPRVHTRGG
jgi:hypothetical protein